MFRERAHDVVEALAHQNNFAAPRNGFVQLGDAARFQSWLQKIFEEFFTEQIEAITARSAQNGVEQARGKHAIRHVKEWPRDRERSHGAAARPALQEALRVPRKK